MVQRRKLLAALGRARLAELASQFGIPGLSGKSKDAIVQAMAAARSVKTAELLATLGRDELKGLCRMFGLDEGGRDKQSLVARLAANSNGGPHPKARSPRRRKTDSEAAQPAAAAKKGNPSMTKKSSDDKRPIEQYEHADKTRMNNPPVGLVTPATDPDLPKKTYQYDPHLDPQLVWAGKAEHTSFEVPTVSLHVHERIDPRTIIRAVQKRNGEGSPKSPRQRSLFEEPEEQLPLREAIEFYKHAQGWTNRLIAGDSLVVMNSLLEKEGMAGKVQMVYIDPPYGIKYGSNFQPFVNRREVTDGKDEDLTQEPEMIRAFRDTWEIGVHSYLTNLRDRLLLVRELLHESGSCFLQIGDENIHLVRVVLDEVFGRQNFMGLITFTKTAGATVNYLAGTADYLLWYTRNSEVVKYHQLYKEKTAGGTGAGKYDQVQLPDDTRRSMTPEEKADPDRLPAGSRIYRLDNLTSQSEGREKGEGAACWFPVMIEGREFRPTTRGRWKTNQAGMDHLLAENRVQITGSNLSYVRFLDDFPAFPISNVWSDVGGGVQSRANPKVYVVQTGAGPVQRCMLMTTDPGDLVLDPTCGSGTMAHVAEQWGRRWITCDTSRVALTLAKQRLMTTVFEYYGLASPSDGVCKGFKYKTIPHVTLRSIATGEPAAEEVLLDQPLVDKARARVTGPFTVEAVPAPAVRPITEIVVQSHPVDLEEQPALPGIGPLEAQSKLEFTENVAVARYGETLRQRQWRDELLACGIRAKGGQRIEFARLEPLGGTRWLQCEGETKGPKPERVVVSFGPEHAPLGAAAGVDGPGRGTAASPHADDDHLRHVPV